MTTLDLPVPGARPRNRQPAREPASKPGRGPAAVALPKPRTADDIDRIHDLARQLAGRPVPDVRMTEQQFEEWCDEDVKAEWVDGEVVLMSPENLESAT